MSELVFWALVMVALAVWLVTIVVSWGADWCARARAVVAWLRLRSLTAYRRSSFGAGRRARREMAQFDVDAWAYWLLVEDMAERGDSYDTLPWLDPHADGEAGAR